MSEIAVKKEFTISEKEFTMRPEQGSLKGLIEVAQDIARKRQKVMEAMRAAFLNGDDTTALSYAKQLCGLANAEDSHRTNSSIN